MTKRTKRTGIIVALLVGSLALTAGVTNLQAADNHLPAPKQKVSPKAHFFEGKIAEVNVDAKWLKVDKQTYHVDDKTKLMNRNMEIKLEDLKVGTEVHGLAKKEENGNMLATIVKVGPKPNDGPQAANPHRPE